MQIWTVANHKGGVGKTTTALTLAGLLAEKGKRVLLVDLDPQGSSSSYFGFDPDFQENSSHLLFQNPNSNSKNIKSLVIKTKFEHLSLLPASTSMASLERNTIGKNGMGLIIKNSLNFVVDSVDNVLIDSPPVLGVLMINAIVACDKLIIPVQTEYLALKGLERMMHTLTMLQRSNSEEIKFYIVPTMYDQRTNASVSSLRDLRINYENYIWPGKIGIDTSFRDASKAGIPPSSYSPLGRGVTSYRSLLNWLLEM